MGIMKNNEDNKLQDDLIRDLFRKSESLPNRSLKEQIMLNIEASESSVMEYEPVISKKVLWIIGAAFTSLIAYLLLWFKDSSGKSYLDVQWPSIDITFSVDWFSKLNTAFEGIHLEMPELPFTALAAILAIMVMGFSFIISYRMRAFQ